MTRSGLRRTSPPEPVEDLLNDVQGQSNSHDQDDLSRSRARGHCAKPFAKILVFS